MDNLTFAEQVKIILSRKGLTIKRLAEMIEEQTGMKMSRQNLTQRLGRDNFQEKDMQMIAEVLGYSVSLQLVPADGEGEDKPKRQQVEPKSAKNLSAKHTDTDVEKQANQHERDMTLGELYQIHQALDNLEETTGTETAKENKAGTGSKAGIESKAGVEGDANTAKKDITEETIEETIESIETMLGTKAKEEEPAERIPQEGDADFEPVLQHEDAEEDLELGEMNPYTGREYQSNSVRMHPTRIGYVQVYDRSQHKWTDMTEWAFLGYQERKKKLLGKNYEPPIYLD